MPGRHDASRLFPARRRDFERALGGFLPFHLLEIGDRSGFLDSATHRIRQHLRAFEMGQKGYKTARSKHRNPAGPLRLRSLLGGADKSRFNRAGVQRRDEHSGRGDHAPVQRQFAHGDPVSQLFGIGHAHRCQ